MSTYRVTLEFDLIIDDEEELRSLARDVLVQVNSANSSGVLDDRGPGDAAQDAELAAQIAAQDIDTAVAAGSVGILSRGLVGLEGIAITRIAASSEAQPM
jgi:hypothetical protein